MIFFLGLLLIVSTAKDAPSLSPSNSCIQDLLATFVKAQDCTHLSDQDKIKLAMKMTQCLLLSMKKPFPVQCLDYDCDLEGDAWSTFTNFFAHVDNLCHFYWQTLHHQRAEALIGRLSESSSKAEQMLRENARQTHQILSMQQKLHSSLDESLKSQQRMSSLINSSAVHLTNLTFQIQSFVQSIQKDIDANYASIRSLLGIINHALTQIVEFQGYLRADLTSAAGILFFLAQFLIVLYVTSHPKYQAVRTRIIIVLLVQAALELSIPSLIHSLIGTRCYRYIFIVLKVIQLKECATQQQKPQTVIAKSLSTPRLERVFRKIGDHRNREEENRLNLSCLAAKVVAKLNSKGRRGVGGERGAEGQ